MIRKAPKSESSVTIYVTAEEPIQRNTGEIRLYDADGFEGMRRAGQLTARCLDEVASLVEPGRTTEEIDEFVLQFGLDNGALPATLNYRGFRKSTCTSKNEVICHGIPDRKPLREGDIINIDVTLILDGWHGDSSRMYTVGRIKPFAQRLLEVTHECLMLGIDEVRPGTRTGAIGHAIQTHAERQRFSVVRDFCGHGVGKLFHDAPNVLHYGRPRDGVEMRPGMIFTIEPMINLGKPNVRVLNDGWTAITADRKLTAQYEHTVGLTENGCEIFTLSPSGLHRPGLDQA